MAITCNVIHVYLVRKRNLSNKSFLSDESSLNFGYKILPVTQLCTMDVQNYVYTTELFVKALGLIPN